MYKSFFRLRENPFNVNPDPRFLFRTNSIEEALASLAYGIRTRKGFILLTGEVGTGKTMLLNKLLDWLHQQQVATAFVFNTHVSASHLFDFIMADFGIPCESREKSHQVLALSRWLLERYRAGETAALVIDEAQNLTPRVLEEIRLLTNLETSTEKLLQIVLSGQPELEKKLKRPELRQLRQRITLRCRTAPLSLEETHGYITERLHIAGANGEPIFAPEAIQSIYHHTRGIPRVINLLCDHALISAFAGEQRLVSPELIEEVAAEFELDLSDPAAAGGRTPGDRPLGSDSSPPVEALLRDLAQLLEQRRERDAVSAESGEKKT
jgi:general secretion pathway protein A